MLVRQIVDEQLAQYAYLIGCQRTGEALLIDPERDIDRYVAIAEGEGLRVTAVAETHIHADFVAGTRELAARLPDLRVYLSGEGGPDWRYTWPARDGVAATLLRDGDRFRIGHVELRAWHTPGHTPEHLSYFVTDHGAGADTPIALVSGDFVFVGDLGRPDLLESAVGARGTMGPAAQQLYASAQRLLDVPEFVQVWPGHGAGSACGKSLGAVPSSTVGYERRFSRALAAAREGEARFVEFILSDQPEAPVYFARMKALNRDGAPVLGRLPAPRALTAAELVALAGADDVQVIDTRMDRAAFFAAHVAGSLLAPLTRSFPTTVGSLADPSHRLVLIVDEARLGEAVRQLVRVGFDRVEAWARPAVIDELRRDPAAPIERIVSIDAESFRRRRDTGAVLDVRSAREYRAAHVAGATHVAHTQLQREWRRLRADRPWYVHCASGARAAAAAAFLAAHGLDVVHVEGDAAGCAAGTCGVQGAA